jgi:hypothetical protein
MFVILPGLFLGACTIIRPGETGVKRKLGKLGNTAFDLGVFGVIILFYLQFYGFQLGRLIWKLNCRCPAAKV